MAVTTLNTNASLSGKTIMVIENDETITSLKTFSRGAATPFAVAVGSLVVTNLDADKVDGKHSTNLLLLDGTQVMTGKLGLGAIGQLQFPAAQNASADANCLDDYEEGTFTPTITSGGGGAATYTTQIGYYTKVGKNVWVGGRVTLATAGTLAAGSISLSGLPFTSEAGAYSTLAVGFWGNMTTAVVYLGLFIGAGSTSASLYHAAAAATGLSATQLANISGTLDIIYGGTYRANA